mmetsp:Transcript_32036/g.102021  ORF Transcript_32036/g.102021 Transcript_32036/m.102021 type:complete len:220 (+) Transcript_32036:142-801(+)
MSFVYPRAWRAEPSASGCPRGPHSASYTPGSPHTNNLVSRAGGKACLSTPASLTHPSSAHSSSSMPSGGGGAFMFTCHFHRVPIKWTTLKRFICSPLHASSFSRRRMSFTLLLPYRSTTRVASPAVPSTLWRAWYIGAMPLPTAIMVIVLTPVNGYCSLMLAFTCLKSMVGGRGEEAVEEAEAEAEGEAEAETGEDVHRAGSNARARSKRWLDTAPGGR